MSVDQVTNFLWGKGEEEEEEGGGLHSCGMGNYSPMHGKTEVNVPLSSYHPCLPEWHEREVLGTLQTHLLSRKASLRKMKSQNKNKKEERVKTKPWFDRTYQ